MDPYIDIEQRMSEQAANAARTYLDSLRAKPGATGRAPDGTVEVTVDGLGDIAAVRVRIQGVPMAVASRLAESFQLAWRTASGTLARAAVRDNPLADEPAMAGLMAEQIAQRYGVPAPSPSNEDDDCHEGSVLRRYR